VKRAILALLTAACIGSGTHRCPNGTVCPDTLVCSPAGECVAPEAVSTCAGADAAGGPCTIFGNPGVCRAGLCIQIACGNGYVDPGEVCDPGPPDDPTDPTCRSDCRDHFRCGNGLVDPGEECDCGMDPNHLPTGCRVPNTDATGLTATRTARSPAAATA
jgi:hypothetical protein